MKLNALKQAMVEGYEFAMKALPEGRGIVATLLPRSFPGGPIPEEYRREFRWTQDLPHELDKFADEAVEVEEPDWAELGYDE